MTTVRRRPPAPKLAETKVLRRVDITDDLLLMWISRPEGWTFKAGQYCTIGSEGIERAYSISSAPHEEDIELFVELVPPPDGNLTPLMWDLHEGDTMTMRPRAKGIFVFKPKWPNQLLVATVTGVVPYISFLRDYLHKGNEGHHFYVLQGASYQDEFTYLEELERAGGRAPGQDHLRPDCQPADRGAQRRLDRRDGPRQQHRREVHRRARPQPGGHPRLRLRPPRDDRGRQGQAQAPGLQGRRRAFLEAGLASDLVPVNDGLATLRPFPAVVLPPADVGVVPTPFAPSAGPRRFGRGVSRGPRPRDRLGSACGERLVLAKGTCPSTADLMGRDNPFTE